jgi:transcription antitermination factor NusG
MDWICLLVNPSSFRRGREVLESELNKIFGPDILGLRVVFGEERNDVEEYYAFIRCRNYQQYISGLRNSSAIKGVLTTYDNPAYLSDADVSEFLSSIEQKDVPDNLSLGDVVKVKEGYLSGLTGIVMKSVSDSEYDVLFSFHTRKFHEKMQVSHLTLVDSIFDHLKSPVLTDNLRESGILWACVTGIQFCGAYLK